jgi:hypothetical protein
MMVVGAGLREALYFEYSRIHKSGSFVYSFEEKSRAVDLHAM